MHRAIPAVSALVLLIVCLLSVPSFVDWNEYRPEFSAQIANATGRAVKIDGEVTLAILPYPTMSVAHVHIANIFGGSSDDFITVSQIDVRLALAPLLRGLLRFQSIEIVRPVLFLEIFPDGTNNWTFREPEKSNTSETVQGLQSDTTKSSEQALPDLRLDALDITDGSITYLNAVTGAKQAIDNITAHVKAMSLSGPYEIVADVDVFGSNLDVDLTAGKILADRGTPVVLSIRSDEGRTTAKFSGLLSALGSNPGIRGKAVIEGSNVASIIDAFALQVVQTEIQDAAIINTGFVLEADMVLDPHNLTAEDMSLRLGNMEVVGNGGILFAKVPEINLELSTRRIDLDSLLSGWNRLAPDETRSERAGTVTGFAFSQLKSFGRAAVAQTFNQLDFSFPREIVGNFQVRAEVIAYKGRLLREAKVAGALSNGDLTLTDISVMLPASTPVKAFGSVYTKDRTPFFDINFEMSTRNLRALLEWVEIRIDRKTVPMQRLNNMSVAFKMQGTFQHMYFENINFLIDTIDIEGTGRLDLTDHYELTANLSSTFVNLDSYFPFLKEYGARGPGILEDDHSQREAVDSIWGEPLEVMSYFNQFKGKWDLEVDELVAGGFITKNVQFDAFFEDGQLEIRRVGFSDLAGTRVMFSGSILDLGKKPEIKELSYTVVVGEPGRFYRTLTWQLPSVIEDLNQFDLTGTVNGSLDNLSFKNKLVSDELTVETSGRVENLFRDPQYSLDTKIRAVRYSDFVKLIGFPKSQTFGALDPLSIDFSAAGNSSSWIFRDTRIEIGQNIVTGHGDMVLVSNRPTINMDIQALSLDIDQLFPVDMAARFIQRGRQVEQSGEQTSSVLSSRWSERLMNSSFLRDYDSIVRVNGERLIIGDLRLEDFQMNISIEDGLVQIPDLIGQLYGGPITAAVTANVRPGVSIKGMVNIKDADLATMSHATASEIVSRGILNLSVSFEAEGSSELQLINTLSGEGFMSAEGINIDGMTQGEAVHSVFTPIQALSRITGLLGGPVKEGVIDLSSKFSVKDGVAKLFESKIKSNLYSGEFSGSVDLPRWLIDVSGQLRLETNVLTSFMSSRLQLPSLVPVSVSGPLDMPDIKIQTGTVDPSDMGHIPSIIDN